jgi:ABC-type Fe3+/spermidine/putrescine transport system ATPase subunit
MTAVAPQKVGVRIDGVSKRFAHRVKGEVFAVRDVTLDVGPGEFLSLLGPSGCGKTTTLRMIAGFEMPDAGRIRFGERDVTRLPANQRDIGFVFQNYALFPHLSVFDNVAYGLRVRGHDDAAVAKSVGDVLGLVGLAGYDHQFSGQLSGGEQQRVALARAIVIRPSVLLFDEPLSNLDAKLRVQMRQEIRDLQRRLGITTIYVTHDQEEAMAVSDRIAVMHQGRVVQEGSAEDLYHRPASQFVAQFVGRVNLVAGEGGHDENCGARHAAGRPFKAQRPDARERGAPRRASRSDRARARRSRYAARDGGIAYFSRREERVPGALRRREPAGGAL